MSDEMNPMNSMNSDNERQENKRIKLQFKDYSTSAQNFNPAQQ